MVDAVCKVDPQDDALRTHQAFRFVDLDFLHDFLYLSFELQLKVVYPDCLCASIRCQLHELSETLPIETKMLRRQE